MTTSDVEQRSKLISLFDGLYVNTAAINDLIRLMEDVSVFFNTLASRLEKEQKDYLHELYKDLGLVDWRHYLINNWICSRAIAKKFNELINQVQTSRFNSKKQNKAIHDLIILFKVLSSHADGDGRINTASLARILEPNLDIYKQGGDYEVFGIYTDEERRIINGFSDRLLDIWPGLPSLEYVDYWNKIKSNVSKYYQMDDETILCSKLLTALGEIQTNSYAVKDEFFYNNQVAFCLKGYYGPSNVHREKPQGTSASGKGQGETDIIIYQDGCQIGLVESICLSSFDTDEINNHIERLVGNYDSQGVACSFLLVFVLKRFKYSWFSRIETHLAGYQFPFKVVEPVKRKECGTKNMCHHVVRYNTEESERALHVFSVLLEPSVLLKPFECKEE